MIKIPKQEQAFEYNSCERVITATFAVLDNSTENCEYAQYNPNGNRINKKNYPTNTTVYYLGKDFTRMVNSTDTYDTIYYYDPTGALVARRDVWDSNKTYYYHPDHLGSTTLITDQNGNVVEEITYEPYGSVYSGGSDASRYLYTGKEPDQQPSCTMTSRHTRGFRTVCSTAGHSTRRQRTGTRGGFSTM